MCGTFCTVFKIVAIVVAAAVKIQAEIYVRNSERRCL